SGSPRVIPLLIFGGVERRVEQHSSDDETLGLRAQTGHRITKRSDKCRWYRQPEVDGARRTHLVSQRPEQQPAEVLESKRLGFVSGLSCELSKMSGDRQQCAHCENRGPGNGMAEGPRQGGVAGKRVRRSYELIGAVA